MGYVPSLKADGFIRVHESDELALVKGLKDRGEEVEARGVPEDRLARISEESHSKNESAKAIRAGSDQEHLLDETENNLKFGIFSLTLQYFRAMTLVRRQYETWSGRQAALALEGKHAPREVTKEREKMEAETTKLDERLRRAERAEAKAKVGMERRRQRLVKERAEQREKMITVVRKRQLEERSATKIAALYRGHLGRLAAMKWAVRKAETDAMRALQHAAAVAIQRVWRGIDGRAEAEEKRIEMAEFIAQMRAAEAAEEEEEYWRTIPGHDGRETCADGGEGDAQQLHSRPRWIGSQTRPLRTRKILNALRRRRSRRSVTGKSTKMTTRPGSKAGLRCEPSPPPHSLLCGFIIINSVGLRCPREKCYLKTSF